MWSLGLHTETKEGSERSTNSQDRGCEGRRGGEEMNPESCFYGGAFPLSQYSEEQEVSGDFLPKQYVYLQEVQHTNVPTSLCVSFDCDSLSEE